MTAAKARQAVVTATTVELPLIEERERASGPLRLWLLPWLRQLQWQPRRRDLMKQVDWSLLFLLSCLFPNPAVVVQGHMKQIPRPWLVQDL